MISISYAELTGGTAAKPVSGRRGAARCLNVQKEKHAVGEKVALCCCPMPERSRCKAPRPALAQLTGVIGRRDRRCPMSERSEGQHTVSEKVARVAVPCLNVQGRCLNVQRWKHGHGPPLSHRRRSSRRYSCPLHPLRKLRKVRKAPQAPPSRTRRSRGRKTAYKPAGSIAPVSIA